jgi:predicted PurR-regulated permease PerM
VYETAREGVQAEEAPLEPGDQAAPGAQGEETGEETGEGAGEETCQGAGEGANRSRFSHRLQGRLDEFRSSLAEWGVDVPQVSVSMRGLREQVSVMLAQYGDDTAAMGLQATRRGVGVLAGFFGRLVELAGLFLLLPLYTYYFLFVQRDLNGFVLRHLPKRDRARIAGVAGQIGEVIASFFRGRLGVCLMKGLFLSLGLFVAGVDYALLFGLLAGFLSMIPLVGPFLGFVLAFVVGILDHGVVSALIRTGIVFGLGELLEGYVLVPKILGDSLGLHPLVVFVSLLAGGAALGMLGVLIALPLTASLVILVREFVLPAVRAFADEEPSSA